MKQSFVEWMDVNCIALSNLYCLWQQILATRNQYNWKYIKILLFLFKLDQHTKIYTTKQ